jgi:hypothetical protein
VSETIEALQLDVIGRVPWWPAERAEVTLHHVLVRMTDETARHAGQMDIMREPIDGAAGRSAGNSSLGPDDQASRQAHYERVERTPGKRPGYPRRRRASDWLSPCRYCRPGASRCGG